MLMEKEEESFKRCYRAPATADRKDHFVQGGDLKM